jgi:hypothetical protein
MALTLEQLAVFKTALFAETDPTLVAYRTNGQTSLIRDWYNATDTSNYVIWRNSVTLDEIMQNGFDWTQVDNQTVGKARIWEWLFSNQTKSINPSKANVRAGIDEAWKGTAAMLAVRAAVYVHCKKFSSRIDKLFATGAGTDASPSVALYLTLTEQDVITALNS